MKQCTSTCSKEEITMDIKHFKMHNNKMWDSTSDKIRGSFIILKAFINKED